MRKSTATKRSERLGNWSEWAAARSNGEFFAEALRAMEKFGVGNQGLMTIGLVGSRDIPGVTLRRAQSVLRWDRRPSLWSHAFLISKAWRGKTRIQTLPIYEVPLFCRSRSFPRPERNAVTESKLGLYDDSRIDANVALIAVCARQFEKGPSRRVEHLSRDDVAAVRERARDVNYDRMRYDLWDSLGAWQRFLWSDGEGQNPLRAGVPICGSSYVEMAFEAINLDLVPAASARNSAPEHIWNAAVWWHQDESVEADDTENPYVMRGCYAVRDPGASMID